MEIELKQLQLFVEAAEAGSLSRAAVLRGVKHSAFSKQISALERCLGGRLFSRTGRGIALTELGEALLPRARALVAEAQSLRAASEEMLSVPRGNVVIAMQSSVARPLGVPLIQEARRLYPGIRVHLIEGYSAHIQEWLANGRADVGIVNAYGRAAAQRATAIGQVRLWLVGSNAEHITRKRSVRFADLRSVPLALPALPNGLRVMLEETARRNSGFRLNVEVEIDSIQILKDLVAGGDLFTVLPPHAVAEEIRVGQLTGTPIVEPILVRSLTVVATNARPLSSAARLIFRMTRDVASQLTVTCPQ